MEILPIRSLAEEDGPVIGTELLNLGKLFQQGLPVADGVIVVAPKIELKTLVEHYQLKDKEIFEQKLLLVKSEVKKIPPPEELIKALSKRKIDPQKLWFHLLEFWINQIRSKLWREGFSPNLIDSLSCQPVFFTEKIKASGEAYYDFEQNETIFNLTQGQITSQQKKIIGQLVELTNKTLTFPQIVSWIVEKRIKIVKLTPFTQYPKTESLENLVSSGYIPQKLDAPNLKSTIKIFLQADQSFRTEPDLDGVLICSENMPDFDQKLIQLISFSSELTPKPVIFKLFDKKEKGFQIRGSLNLLHKTDILKQDAEAILFLRNKKKFVNVYPAIPFDRSVEEFKKIKQELFGHKISRSANLKLYLELAVPENYLNLDSYIEAGFDGAILNLDELAPWVGGFDPEGEEAIFYQKQVDGMINLIGPVLKKLKSEKIPIIASGHLALHDDVLSFLVENGLFGLVVDYTSYYSIHERIRLIEKRIVRQKLNENSK